jgi:hypothetical protein
MERLLGTSVTQPLAARVKRVLETFLMREMVRSELGLDAEKLAALALEKAGRFKITNIGRSYFSKLLTRMWYFVGVKKGSYFDPTFLTKDAQGHRKILSKHLVAWLIQQEKEEDGRIDDWDATHTYVHRFPPLVPHLLAKRALKIDMPDSQLMD